MEGKYKLKFSKEFDSILLLETMNQALLSANKHIESAKLEGMTEDDECYQILWSNLEELAEIRAQVFENVLNGMKNEIFNLEKKESDLRHKISQEFVVIFPELTSRQFSLSIPEMLAYIATHSIKKDHSTILEPLKKIKTLQDSFLELSTTKTACESKLEQTKAIYNRLTHYGNLNKDFKPESKNVVEIPTILIQHIYDAMQECSKQTKNSRIKLLKQIKKDKTASAQDELTTVDNYLDNLSDSLFCMKKMAIQSEIANGTCKSTKYELKTIQKLSQTLKGIPLYILNSNSFTETIYADRIALNSIIENAKANVGLLIEIAPLAKAVDHIINMKFPQDVDLIYFLEAFDIQLTNYTNEYNKIRAKYKESPLDFVVKQTYEQIRDLLKSIRFINVHTPFGKFCLRPGYLYNQEKEIAIDDVPKLLGYDFDETISESLESSSSAIGL